ncbi:hypothetical protein B0T14DRAFT_501697 [Immersiella caudata]|uniref:Uncharacterized protein n=1 Tax=Immersiella caudata TaxID=314043 RepID=A0AA40CAR9_9PEZI|nr:hypothetical protein B0T14DRAFT_501697 [Immersiella caudata]
MVDLNEDGRVSGQGGQDQRTGHNTPTSPPQSQSARYRLFPWGFPRRFTPYSSEVDEICEFFDSDDLYKGSPAPKPTAQPDGPSAQADPVDIDAPIVEEAPPSVKEDPMVVVETTVLVGYCYEKSVAAEPIFGAVDSAGNVANVSTPGMTQEDVPDDVEKRRELPSIEVRFKAPEIVKRQILGVGKSLVTEKHHKLSAVQNHHEAPAVEKPEPTAVDEPTVAEKYRELETVEKRYEVPIIEKQHDLPEMPRVAVDEIVPTTEVHLPSMELRPETTRAASDVTRGAPFAAPPPPSRKRAVSAQQLSQRSPRPKRRIIRTLKAREGFACRTTSVPLAHGQNHGQEPTHRHTPTTPEPAAPAVSPLLAASPASSGSPLSSAPPSPSPPPQLGALPSRPGTVDPEGATADCIVVRLLEDEDEDEDEEEEEE